jgi:predicted glutamine amidotransferase
VDLDRLQAVVRQTLAWVDDAVMGLGERPPALNFLLTNGRIFLANRHGRELWYATQKLHCRDAETCKEPDKVCLLRERPSDKVNHLLVASERIGEEDVWEEIPEGGMVVLGEDFRLRQSVAPNPHFAPVQYSCTTS